MNTYYSTGYSQEPFILFDIYNQIFEITGIANHDHTTPPSGAMKWLQEHSAHIPKNTTFVFKLKKYNRNGIKAMIPLIREIRKIEGVNIAWHCYQSTYLPWRLRWVRPRIVRIKAPLPDSNEGKIEALINTQSEENIELALQLIEACKINKTPYLYRALINQTLNWTIQQRFERGYFFSLPFYNKNELRVSSSNITQIPSQIDQMWHLTKLDLSNNPIHELPPSIAKLTKLKVLDISNTFLETLPQEIAQLTSLEEIHLKNTKINHFSLELLSLPNLKVITLNEALIKQVENDQEASSKFKSTHDVQFWGMSTSPEFIKHPPYEALSPIYFAGTDDTPQVKLDKNNYTFEITGNSFRNNPEEFYRVIIDWLQIYAEDPLPSTTFTFKFDFIEPEGSSRPWVRKIMYELESLPNVCIRWCFRESDEELEEMATSFYIESNIEYIPY